jgi:hypothetical protein
MDNFEQSAAPSIENAVTWARESTQLWFDTYVHLVDGAAKGTTSADSFARDLSTLAAAGARDMARVATVWSGLGAAMLNLDLPDPSGTTGGKAKGKSKPGGTGAKPAKGAKPATGGAP